jgi:DNA-binding NarL/FixJ family response regulator
MWQSKAMNSKRTVLVVEDEMLIRSLVARQLEHEGFEVFAAANALEARKISDAYEVDVAVIDIELGHGPSGFDLASILRSNDPGIAIVFLTHLPNPKLMGVDNSRIPKNAAYLVKDKVSDSKVLTDAIEATLRERVTEHMRFDITSENKFKDVSRSQIQVFQMMANGLSNHEIAAQRGTSVRAVENLIRRAMATANISVDGGQSRVLAVREFLKATGQLRG